MEHINVIGLLQKVSAINKKYENIADVTGERFNIFRILKVESKEVKMHSAFLAELLNPSGSHQQKDSFLKLFIQIFKIKGFEHLDKIDAEIKVEEVNKFGRIDIIIKPLLGRTIVIENKIFALDQFEQLIRYKREYPDCHLLYLTLDGREPDSSSIKNESVLLKKSEDYFIISYKEDIIEWLLACRKEAANQPLLRETLTQYINLIKYLTHQTMSEQTKIEVIDTIISNAENIEAAENIANSWKAVKYKIIDNLKTKIINDDYIKGSLELHVAFNNDYVLGDKNSSFWFYKKGWKCCICFCFDMNFDSVFFGICNLDENIQMDLTLRNSLDEKLLKTNIGKNLNFENWLWVSDFEIWDTTPWKNIEAVIPNAIKEKLEIFISNFEGLNL